MIKYFMMMHKNPPHFVVGRVDALLRRHQRRQISSRHSRDKLVCEQKERPKGHIVMNVANCDALHLTALTASANQTTALTAV
jgi:hypothetical protein